MLGPKGSNYTYQWYELTYPCVKMKQFFKTKPFFGFSKFDKQNFATMIEELFFWEKPEIVSTVSFFCWLIFYETSWDYPKCERRRLLASSTLEVATSIITNQQQLVVQICLSLLFGNSSSSTFYPCDSLGGSVGGSQFWTSVASRRAYCCTCSLFSIVKTIIINRH